MALTFFIFISLETLCNHLVALSFIINLTKNIFFPSFPPGTVTYIQNLHQALFLFFLLQSSLKFYGDSRSTNQNFKLIFVDTQICPHFKFSSWFIFIFFVMFNISNTLVVCKFVCLLWLPRIYFTMKIKITKKNCSQKILPSLFYWFSSMT